MSTESQNMVLEFKIQDSSLAKLQAIMDGSAKGGGKSGGGSQAGNPIGKLQGAFNKGSIGQIAKLSGIALGVIGIIGLVKKITSMMITASPMLQSMLKLFSFSILFILRPIGDFIGFLLRPMMIYFLRTIAIPWYRKMTPLMRMWGTDLGTNLVAFISDPFGKLGEALEGTSWSTLLTAIGGWFAGAGLLGYLDNILKAVGIESVLEIPSLILGEKFTNYVHAAGFQFAEDIRKAGVDTAASIRGFGLSVGTAIFTAGQDAGNAIRNFGLSIGIPIFEAGKALGDSIRSMGVSFGFWWTSTVSDLRVVGDNIKAGIASIFETINTAWNSVIATLDDIKSGIVVVFEEINTAWNSVIATLENIKTGIVSVFDSITAAWNNLIPTIQSTITTVTSALSGFGSYLMVNLGGIGNFVGGHVENFVSFFRDKLGSIWDFVGGYYDAFISFWSAIGTGTVTLSSIWDSIIAFFEEIANWISGFDIGGAISGIGDAIGGGISNIINGGNTSNQTYSGTTNQYFSGGEMPTWEDLFGVFEDNSSMRGNQ